MLTYDAPFGSPRPQICYGTGAEVALVAVAVAATAYSTYAASTQAKNQAQYQSDVQEANAKAADYQAKDAIYRGQQAEDRQRQTTAQLLGSQRSALASSGVDLSDAGTSAQSILSDTAYLGEADALNIRDNASREAYSYQLQGYNSQAGANLSQSVADNTSPLLNTGLSIVGSAANYSASWYRYKGTTPTGTSQTSTSASATSTGSTP